MGSHDSVICALEMYKVVNYQSSLDSKSIDIAAPLAAVCKDETLSFLQLYVDVYVQVPFSFRHPVSGVIVTCGLSHPQFQKAMEHRATTYIDHMDDLTRKMVSQIEQVVILGRNTDIPQSKRYF